MVNFVKLKTKTFRPLPDPHVNYHGAKDPVAFLIYSCEYSGKPLFTRLSVNRKARYVRIVMTPAVATPDCCSVVQV